MTDYKDLLTAARDAKERAYAPYSEYRVGAALLAESGKIYTGANVENAVYSVTCCAERSALFAAVSSGERVFTAIAITSDSDLLTYPCGTCRQALYEFSPDMDVIASNRALEHETKTLSALIPCAFSGKEMEK